jgi:HK97 family phage major capsid protein
MADDKRTRDLSFSSEKPVERWFGAEILDHAPSSVRMGFMQSGRAPLLLNHDMRQQVGIVESASLDKKRGLAGVRFGRTTVATDALGNVDDRILVNTSVGYRIHELRLDTQKGDHDTYRVIDWEPFEASLVAVPADDSVGVGRSALDEPDPPDIPAQVEVETEARHERASSISVSETAHNAKGENMTTQASGAGDGVEVNVTAVQAERQRRDAIINICKSNKIDSRTEAQWIADGERFEDTLGANGAVVRKGIASQLLDVMEERGKAKPGTAAELGLSRSETQRYSLFNSIRYLQDKSDQDLRKAAGFELECSRAIAKKLGRDGSTSVFIPTEVLTRSLDSSVMQRAMATTPGAKGGYMVNVENMGFIDILRNRSVAMRMGARQLSGLTGNVTFPRQTGKQSVTWQAGEGTSITAADQALGQLSMTPKTAICVTDVSEQLLRQASPSAEQFIMADLAAVIAIDGVDNAVLNGTGGAQPLGIKNTTGVTNNQDASSATYAKLLAFVSAAGANNAIRGNPGWVTTTAGAAKLMTVQRFSSTDTPVWTGNMLDGQLVGFNAMSSEQVASGGLIFGSWDEVVIGDWGVLELAIDNGGTRFNTAQVGIRAMWMVDVLVRYPQAFICSAALS